MEQQPFQEQTAKKQPEVQQRTRAVKEKIMVEREEISEVQQRIRAITEKNMVEREENGKINVTIQT